MSAPSLRLVYNESAASTPPPRPESIALASADELEALLRRLLTEHRDGELEVRGPGQSRARICVFEGRIAWVRLSDHPEHLGDVMRRELGLSRATLNRAIAHCRATGRRFDEGMLDLRLVHPGELRACLYRHNSDLLAELMTWSGPLTAQHSGWPHRYDHRYTFELDELLVRPARPTEQQRRLLAAMLEPCVRRLPDLQVACIIEGEEGTLLYTAFPERRAAQDLQGLCTAEVGRLVAHRITGDDGAPTAMVLCTTSTHLVVHRLEVRRDWLLVLGGASSSPVMRLLSLARTAAAMTALPQPEGPSW